MIFLECFGFRGLDPSPLSSWYLIYIYTRMKKISDATPSVLKNPVLEKSGRNLPPGKNTRRIWNEV
jgi:hypothetical protein